MRHLAYDVVGAGPPVVLIHAGIADRRMWDDQIGDSVPPAGSYSHHEEEP